MAKIKTQQGSIYYKPQLLYPGCHVINRQVAYDNLQLIANILDKSHLKWGTIFGTLLGIIRDNDFIEWDEDVDLYILKEEENIFQEQLQVLFSEGFELIRYERGGLYSISRKGEYTDFYVLNKLSNEVRYTLDGGFILEKFIVHQRLVKFRDIELSVPCEIDEYLSFEYGDWKTPVRYYPPQTNFIKRGYLLFYYFFRIYSPDFIYNWWIKRLRNKDLELFKIKCARKGYQLPIDLKIK